MDRSFIRRLPPAAESLMVLLLSFVTFGSVSALKTLRTGKAYLHELAALAVAGLLIYGLLALFYHSFTAYSVLLPVVPPIAAVALNYAGSAVYQYLTERRQKTMIKGMFSQYLNPSVVNELIAHPEKLRLGGEKKELTVFFSDIAGFTNFSEKLDPVELVHLLNEYLSEMTDIILRHDGTLDKYVGDAVMAIWGAPVELPNNALNACRAALQMQTATHRIAERWKDEGKPELVVRMGLNTDRMVVGNVGGSSRFDYTVIGDAVNLGSRLEGANKTYGTQIMISERTYELVKEEMLCRELDLIRVKGKSQPIRVFELVGAAASFTDTARLEMLAAYRRGLDLYHARRFADAMHQFYQALQTDPDDGPSNLYFERSQRFMKSPPPEDWNGVYEMKSK